MRIATVVSAFFYTGFLHHASASLRIILSPSSPAFPRSTALQRSGSTDDCCARPLRNTKARPTKPSVADGPKNATQFSTILEV
ncbi:hypothetical protein IWX92DRAFT_376711 [Phyllosticta citricarpa]